MAFLCLSVSFANAQPPDIDLLYQQARFDAHSGKYAEARRQLRALLTRSPDHADAIMLMGQTYGWENKFDSARIILRQLLPEFQDDPEWLLIAANTELWDKQYDKALAYTNNGLSYKPDDEPLLTLKARITEEQSLDILSKNKKPDADTLYLAAFDKSRKEGKQKEARRMAHSLLRQYPTYDDANLLIAQTYVAEGKYDTARLKYRPLLKKKPEDYDLLWQLSGLELADKKYSKALSYASKAVRLYPNDKAFLFEKAWIQYEMGNYDDALKSVDALLKKDAQHLKATELKKEILSHQYRDYVFWENYFENYASPNTRLVTSAGLFKGFKRTSYIAKLNVGEKIPLIEPAHQIELETYQKLFPSNYLYGEYAFSASNTYFPRHKVALDFFQIVAKSMEVSLGGRMIYWDSNTIKWIITGSVSYTYQDNYFCLRAFYGLPSQSSFVLNYRRYFGNKREQYFYAIATVGSYSDELLQFNAVRGNAYTGIVGIQKYLTNRWFIHANAGYTSDELGERLLATLGVRYYFNMFSKK
jgi:YaiO family outer membrane protein